MAADIVTRPFYAKVEAGKSRISADKLAKILFEYDVDVAYFYQLLRPTYISKQKKIESNLNSKMEQAFNRGKIDEIESCYQEILSQSHSKILKLRAMISVANLKDELKQVDPQIKADLLVEFNDEQNWMTNPESLRLFTNTMPLWHQESLAFFINRLLTRAKNNKNPSELEQERYLRIFENYLSICYDRKLTPKQFQTAHIKEIIDFIMDSKPTIHFLLYKIACLYLKNLLSGNREGAQNIRNEMKKYGYEDLIQTWPK